MTTLVHPEISIFDVHEIRSRAIKIFSEIPYRCRMKGMFEDLDDDDKRALAFIEAVINVLNAKGVIDQEKAKGLGPVVWTEVQEVIDEQLYGQTFTPQKK